MGNKASSAKTTDITHNDNDNDNDIPHAISEDSCDYPETFSAELTNTSIISDNPLSYSGVLVEMTTTTDEEGNKAEIAKRRIVKGMLPPTTTTATDLPPNEEEEEEESSSLSQEEHHHSHVTMIVSNTNDQDLLQESIEQNRKQRLAKLGQQQKSKRNEKIQERRKHPSENKVSAPPNPFSRFLSAFSVEPQFPNHKRAHGVEFEDEDDEVSSVSPAPSKMPRREKEVKKDDDSSGSFKSWMEQLPWIATATAVVAIAVVVALQLKKK